RRGGAGKLVRVDDLASLVARVRPIDCELPRPERTEALNQMLRYGRIVRIAATIPAPRSEPSKWLVDPRDPGLLRPARVAHEADGEQPGKAPAERVRQSLDEARVRDVDVDHRQIAVELHAG